MGRAFRAALAPNLTAQWRSRDGHLVRAAREADALLLGPMLRRADRAEIQASTGLAPCDALLHCLAQTRLAFAVAHRDAMADDPPLALFGVGDHPLGPDIGAPWLLAHRDAPRIARSLFREAARWVELLGRDRAMLSNRADARNTLHLRWLTLLGFTHLRRIEHCGVERRPFIEFVKLIH